VEGIGILRGRSGMKKGYSKFQNVPKEIIIEGDKAFVASHISAATRRPVAIEAEVAIASTFVGGQDHLHAELPRHASIRPVRKSKGLTNLPPLVYTNAGCRVAKAMSRCDTQ